MIEMIVLGLMLALALLSVTVGMILGAIDDCFFYYPLSSIDSKRHAKHEKLDKAKEISFMLSIVFVGMAVASVVVALAIVLCQKSF